MRTILCSFAVAFTLLSPACFAAKTADPSIGVCTRKDEFQKRQEALDARVSRLASEKNKTQRAKLVASLTAAAEKDIECLIRYREPCLVPVFARVAKTSKKWFTRTRALYAIKMLGDASAAPAAISALNDKDGMVREAAASALGRLAGKDARSGLEKRLKVEQNPYVRATIESALEQIRGEVRPFTPDDKSTAWKEDLVGPEGARRVPWVWTKKGKRAFNAYDAKTLDYGEAKRFCYPIQRYKESLFGGYPRKSFGSKGTHAGEDCAWFREGCSFYAVADGLVRMVQGAGGDWGFLVVIEHRLGDHQYMTSVYGHCADDVLVRPGQTVKAGQRIATQGLSCSVENGGYGSHLHFGLGNGPYRRPAGLAIGDSVNLKMPDGKTHRAPVLRLVYSKTKKNSFGWPALAIIVRKPDGGTRMVDIPEQPVGREISWFRAYIKNCRGWLNPQVTLPKLVDGTFSSEEKL